MSATTNLHLINDDGAICSAKGVNDFMTASLFPQGQQKTSAVPSQSLLRSVGEAYNVVGVFGGQSSGKSTLLNHLFHTSFQTMDDETGRQQTTKGCFMAHYKEMEAKKEGEKAEEEAEKNLFVLDFEGTDGMERGEDQSFEKQLSLFALSVADTLIVNMWATEVGRFNAANLSLLRTVFEVNLQLQSKQTKTTTSSSSSNAEAATGDPVPTTNTSNNKKTTLLIVLRDFTSGSEEGSTGKVMASLEKIWGEAHKPSTFTDAHLEDFFRVRFKCMPHYQFQRPEFDKAVGELRRQFTDPCDEKYLFNLDLTSPTAAKKSSSNNQNNKKVPLDGLSQYLGSCWGFIKKHKDLDIPSQRAMLARQRCREGAQRVFEAFAAFIDTKCRALAVSSSPSPSASSSSTADESSASASPSSKRGSSSSEEEEADDDDGDFVLVPRTSASAADGSSSDNKKKQLQQQQQLQRVEAALTADITTALSGAIESYLGEFRDTCGHYTAYYNNTSSSSSSSSETATATTTGTAPATSSSGVVLSQWERALRQRLGAMGERWVEAQCTAVAHLMIHDGDNSGGSSNNKSAAAAASSSSVSVSVHNEVLSKFERTMTVGLPKLAAEWFAESEQANKSSKVEEVEEDVVVVPPQDDNTTTQEPLQEEEEKEKESVEEEEKTAASNPAVPPAPVPVTLTPPAEVVMKYWHLVAGGVDDACGEARGAFFTTAGTDGSSVTTSSGSSTTSGSTRFARFLPFVQEEDLGSSAADQSNQRLKSTTLRQFRGRLRDMIGRRVRGVALEGASAMARRFEVSLLLKQHQQVEEGTVVEVEKDGNVSGSDHHDGDIPPVPSAPGTEAAVVPTPSEELQPYASVAELYAAFGPARAHGLLLLACVFSTRLDVVGAEAEAEEWEAKADALHAAYSPAELSALRRLLRGAKGEEAGEEVVTNTVSNAEILQDIALASHSTSASVAAVAEAASEVVAAEAEEEDEEDGENEEEGGEKIKNQEKITKLSRQEKATAEGCLTTAATVAGRRLLRSVLTASGAPQSSVDTDAPINANTNVNAMTKQNSSSSSTVISTQVDLDDGTFRDYHLQYEYNPSSNSISNSLGRTTSSSSPSSSNNDADAIASFIDAVYPSAPQLPPTPPSTVTRRECLAHIVSAINTDDSAADGATQQPQEQYATSCKEVLQYEAHRVMLRRLRKATLLKGGGRPAGL